MIHQSRWTAAAAIVVSTCLGAVAFAQSADGPAPMNCQKPGEFAPLDRQGSEASRFAKRLDDYKACVGAYSKANGAKADELNAQSRLYADAANKSIDDYNQYVTALNARNNSNDKGSGAERK